MNCPICGKELPDGTKFCSGCGSKIDQQTTQDQGRFSGSQTQNTQYRQNQYQQYQQQTYGDPNPGYYTRSRMTVDDLPDEFKPISMWGYFGYEILFSIPLIGLIVLIIFAFSHKNKNVRNFARSYFCLLIVSLIIIALIIAMGGAAVFSGMLEGMI